MPENPTHPNAQLLRAVYADFSLLEQFARDDIVLHAGGRHGILAGDYVGKKAVLAKEAELYRRSGASLAMVADHVVANDHFGAVLGRFSANRGGERFEGEICGLWRFEDGLIVEHWENCADWPAAERFFVDGFAGDGAGRTAGAAQAAG
jgi:hypothetical protein